jgi:charged multivesicular body protein 5
MDDMEDMKAETDYMNEMMNRNYAVDIDEDELDREMQEIDNDMYMDALKN